MHLPDDLQLLGPLLGLLLPPLGSALIVLGLLGLPSRALLLGLLELLLRAQLLLLVGVPPPLLRLFGFLGILGREQSVSRAPGVQQTQPGDREAARPVVHEGAHAVGVDGVEPLEAPGRVLQDAEILVVSHLERLFQDIGPHLEPQVPPGAAFDGQVRDFGDHGRVHVAAIKDVPNGRLPEVFPHAVDDAPDRGGKGPHGVVVRQAAEVLLDAVHARDGQGVGKLAHLRPHDRLGAPLEVYVTAVRQEDTRFRTLPGRRTCGGRDTHWTRRLRSRTCMTSMNQTYSPHGRVS